LVVPNTSLMDNHQAELAEALERGGYLSVSSIDELERNLPIWLEKVKRGDAGQTFPELDKDRFRRVMDEVAGFA